MALDALAPVGAEAPASWWPLPAVDVVPASDEALDEADVEDAPDAVSACAKPAPRPTAAKPRPATMAPEAAKFLMLLIAFMIWFAFR
jgi:hypothetical protein